MGNLTVNLTVKDAAARIQHYVMHEAVSTKCIGNYANISPEGNEVMMLVFEKYFMRNSSRASLSVIVENLRGKTNVYSVGSGGGQGAFFDFDFGAADSFSDLVEKALRNYLIV